MSFEALCRHAKLLAEGKFGHLPSGGIRAFDKRLALDVGILRCKLQGFLSIVFRFLKIFPATERYSCMRAIVFRPIRSTTSIGFGNQVQTHDRIPCYKIHVRLCGNFVSSTVLKRIRSRHLSLDKST